MRIIFILILIVIALGMALMLVRDVIKAVSKAMKPTPDAPADPQTASAGRLVKDPETGHYIDERTAIKTDIKGTTYYFESAASRDAFLRKQRS